MSSTSKKVPVPPDNIQSGSISPHFDEDELSKELDEINGTAAIASRRLRSNQNHIAPKFDFRSARLQNLSIEYDDPTSTPEESDYTLDSSSDDDQPSSEPLYAKFSVSKWEVKLMKALRKNSIASTSLISGEESVAQEIRNCSIRSNDREGLPQDIFQAPIQPPNIIEATSGDGDNSLPESAPDITVQIYQQLENIGFPKSICRVPRLYFTMNKPATSRGYKPADGITYRPQETEPATEPVMPPRGFNFNDAFSDLNQELKDEIFQPKDENSRLRSDKFALSQELNDEIFQLRRDKFTLNQELHNEIFQLSLLRTENSRLRHDKMALQESNAQVEREKSNLAHQILDFWAPVARDLNIKVQALQRQDNQKKAEISLLTKHLDAIAKEESPEIALRREELAMVIRLEKRDVKKMSALERQVELDAETIRQLKEDSDTVAAAFIGETKVLEQKIRVRDRHIEGLEATNAAFVQEAARLEEIIRQKDVEIEDLTL